MESKLTLNLQPIIHGVQGIVMVGNSYNYLKQQYFLVQDADDRGTGTGVRKYGLGGGGINLGELPHEAITRELKEEMDLDLEEMTSHGCFQKRRPNGVVNDNHLFVKRIPYYPDLKTNDESEVSKVQVLKLYEIIELAEGGQFHEGSIRLLMHFLKGNKFGLLNNPVYFKKLVF